MCEDPNSSASSRPISKHQGQSLSTMKACRLSLFSRSCDHTSLDLVLSTIGLRYRVGIVPSDPIELNLTIFFQHRVRVVRGVLAALHLVMEKPRLGDR